MVATTIVILISTAGTSAMKSSINLYCISCFIAIDEPLFILLLVFTE